MTARLRVEFHCHTDVSKDSLTSARQLVSACRRKGVDRVIVTDHNTIRGALRAQELDPKLVIVGEEIMTDKGELLAAFVRQEIPKHLPVMEAISRLREQQAFISVSHPFDINRSGSWKLEDLESIISYVDAIETFNSRCLLSAYNERALEFARQHGIPGTVGSDAHTPNEVGQAVLLLDPFDDAAGLKAVLPTAGAECKKSPPSVRLLSRFAAIVHTLFPDRSSQ